MAIKNSLIKNIIENYQNIWALSYFTFLGEWDTETYMPANGFAARGQASARLNLLMQKELLDPEFVKLVKDASAETGLTDMEKGIIRILAKQIDNYEKLPAKFLEEYSNLTTSSSKIWIEARKTNDFGLFAPVLTRIFQLTRQKAEYLGYGANPYDALLDEFEEEITVADLDKFFGEIKTFLQKNFSGIFKKNLQSDDKISVRGYDKKLMAALNLKMLKYFGADQKSLRLDNSFHPFTSGLNIHDARITTRYPENGFAGSYLSTIHEYGHALYFLQHAPEIAKTPLYVRSSYGLHESQSRFWENLIGKDISLITIFLQDLRSLHNNFREFTAEDFYRELNLIKPSLIRTEADEVTYNLHIIIRYEIEKALISGEISVKEAPEVWRNKYQQYLGIAPDSDSDGILQDIHWSQGAIGYFPTYSLGTVLSATWAELITDSLKVSLADLISTTAGIEKIQHWLHENIHQYGYTYTLEKLVKKISGKDFSTENWQNYLQKKFLTKK